MIEQNLNRGIALHDEIQDLEALLSCSDLQPYLNFVCDFAPAGRSERTFTIKDEELVYTILKSIKLRKLKLEKKFEEL